MTTHEIAMSANDRFRAESFMLSQSRYENMNSLETYSRTWNVYNIIINLQSKGVFGHTSARTASYC